MPYLKAKHLSARLKRLNKEIDTATCKLIYAGGQIRFQSEKDLEDYIETYFNEIFTDLILIKRQHNIKMQRCDLLCCTKSVKQPVVIELKNEENRGIVSQLTRYCKAILTEKPFAEQIDYSLVKEMVSSTYRKILYGTGEGENHKKLAEIINIDKGVYLFLWLPSHNSSHPTVKAIARFGFVMKPKSTALSREGIIEYIVFSRSGAINMKDKPNSENWRSQHKFSRSGMLKWCEPNSYLYQASGVYSRKIFKDLFWESSLGNFSDWWQSFQQQPHENLEWYIDLAIKTWNYRVK